MRGYKRARAQGGTPTQKRAREMTATMADMNATFKAFVAQQNGDGIPHELREREVAAMERQADTDRMRVEVEAKKSARENAMALLSLSRASTPDEVEDARNALLMKMLASAERDFE